MTFATRTIQGMPQGSPVVFSADVSNNSATTGIRSGSLNLATDGTGDHRVLNITTALAWFSPAPTTGASTGIWVKLTVNSTTGTSITGSATGSVLSFGVGWTFTSTSPTQEGFGTFTLTFYGDAAGTNLLLTQTGTWDVGYTP